MAQRFEQHHPKFYCPWSHERYKWDIAVKHCKKHHGICGVGGCKFAKMLLDKGLL